MFEIVKFSECVGNLRDTVGDAINGSLGVNGDLCVGILTGKIKQTPASNPYTSGDAKGIRVDHEKLGSSDIYVRIQVQKGSDTYATGLIYSGILPPPPDTVALKNFTMKEINLDKHTNNPHKKYSTFWKTVIEIAKICKVTVKDTKKLPSEEFGDEFEIYNTFLKNVYTAATKKLKELNDDYERKLKKTAGKLKAVLRPQLIQSLNVNADQRQAISINNLEN